MRKEVVLITGANGEIGHGLITHLGNHGNCGVIALDVQPLDEDLKPMVEKFVQGDILDTMLLGRLVSEYEILGRSIIWHPFSPPRRNIIRKPPTG